MSGFVVLTQREANLLREQIHMLEKLRVKFLSAYDAETVHQLRVASRRLSETLLYIAKGLPVKWSNRLSQLSNHITKSLSRSREAEVNRKLLHQFRQTGRANPIAVELLMNLQDKELVKWRTKTEQSLNHKSFKQFNKFLLKLTGSRKAKPVRSSILQSRLKEFLGFGWSLSLNDKRMHDLRIRAKKLGYALEIQQRISGRNQGRLLGRIRSLQEVLGQIHDVLILQQVVHRLKNHWNIPDLKLIPFALDQLHENLQLEKVSLASRVYPLFSKIVPALTSVPRSYPSKPVRSSTSLSAQSSSASKSHRRQRSSGRVKRLA